ncbi:FtsX-like permease family protein [Pedobacter westerhofensis]|uniref:FtsX-like permease family protein n=1 Tax=Pedobacter westerhofensis TaxID=425512 RepID=A0A521E759_9SPHI|nr:ABC transporter permease [Pedobacter westerhofensis]SMO79774.1 FtsX-like permease family protein [Pedobacter westerhofensis]
MFKLNFKIALRNIWKNKTSSLINISGLAIGLAACLLLLLYVAYEWNFDGQTFDPSNTYKVLINNVDANKKITNTWQASTNAIAPLFKSEYPEVNAAARIDGAGMKLIANGRKSLKRTACFADPDILNIFDYNFTAGDAKSAMVAPNSIIITESTAKDLFGTTDVLNRSVHFDDKIDLKITGVIKDLPKNTSVFFDFLMPWSLDEALTPWIKTPSWGNFNYNTVVRMNPGTDPEKFNLGIKGFMHRHNQYADGQLMIFPLNKLHLYDTFLNGASIGGKIEQLRLFMGLAIGILLIACINFMNMATAKSEKRAKEVGIKKTIGATRSSLISQFLMESLVLTLLSAVLAIVLIELCIPVFNNLLDTSLKINYSNIAIWLSLFVVVLLTGLISGSYPAFYLSSFNPVQILRKRTFRSGLISINLRQVLVVGQFCFAIILIISTIVIYKQIQFIKNRPIGYDINTLVQMPQEGELYGKFDLLKERLLRSGAVTSLYQSSGTIANHTSSFSGMEWKGSTEADKSIDFSQIAATYDFIQTTGLKLIAGRDFSKNFASDSAALLLNATAVKLMNLADPIGQPVMYHGNKFTVVGVFQDFIQDAPGSKESPLVVAFTKGWGGVVTMRLNTANTVAENLATIEKVVKDINPAYPVELTFVDQLYAAKLKAQRVLAILSNLFGGLAIFISCLGLFGLAAYNAEQRTKEIGVRKILGASVSSLMQLLSFSFLKMVGFAIIISVPIATYLMNNWLKGFDFHTNVSWIIILGTALGTLAIALLTVSFQAYKAANANPVDALKYE